MLLESFEGNTLYSQALPLGKTVQWNFVFTSTQCAGWFTCAHPSSPLFLWKIIFNIFLFIEVYGKYTRGGFSSILFTFIFDFLFICSLPNSSHLQTSYLFLCSYCVLKGIRDLGNVLFPTIFYPFLTTTPNTLEGGLQFCYITKPSSDEGHQY